MRRSVSTKATREAGEFGCVALRLSGTRTGDLLDAVGARLDRLVRASVRDADERGRQRRLIGLSLLSPVLLAPSSAILLPPLLGLQTALVVGSVACVVAVLIAACVVLTGRRHLAEVMALVSGAVALAGLVAAAGGVSSPAAMVLAALAFEAAWVARTSRAAIAGACAILAALQLTVFLEAGVLAGAAASAGYWLIPLAWLATALPRAAAWIEAREEVSRPTATLEDVIEAVVLRTDLGGEVTDASAQSRRILGLAPELLLSGGLFERLHVADRVAYLCALGDLRAGEGYRRVDVRVRVAGSPGSAATDFRAFVVEMMRPTAEDRSIAMLLRPRDEAASARLPAAGQNDAHERSELAKSRMLAAVSHELRTPLNSIIGFSDMLLHGMAGSFAEPRQREYVELVRESGNHLLSLVNSILDVSRIESGAFATNPEPFRFGEAVDMCSAMLLRQAEEKRVALVVDVAPEIGEVHADKRAVKQMLINLVANAVKFTPEGGEVAIGAKRIGSRLHFWVRDTGIGIAAENLRRVGQPFVQVDNDYTRAQHGSGLGLSLVKGLVALHHGTMSIESEPGRGTTVTISLPIERPAQAVTDSARIFAMAGSQSEEVDDGTFRKTA